MLQSGPEIFRFDADKLHVAGWGADATAEWLGEAAASTESTSATQETVLDFSTARLVSYVSLEFLRESLPQSDDALVRNMVQVLRRFVDKAYLESSGANRPTGLDSISGIGAIGADSGNANGGEVNADDLKKAVETLDVADAPEDGRAWFMHPRSWAKIARLKDNDGRYFVGDIQTRENRQLLGYPVFTSSQISTTQTKGTGTALSHILLAAMSDIAVAMGAGNRDIEIAASDSVRFLNAQVAFRVLFRTDIQAFHAASIVDMTGVV